MYGFFPLSKGFENKKIIRLFFKLLCYTIKPLWSS